MSVWIMPTDDERHRRQGTPAQRDAGATDEAAGADSPVVRRRFDAADPA
jgi:hypothetical protein